MAVAVAENQPLRSVPDFEQAKKPREYYYDLAARVVIAGQLALQRYFDDGSQADSVYRLADLLEDESIELPVAPDIDPHQWTKDRAIKNGRVVCAVVTAENGQKKVNDNKLHRAYRIGLLPSSRQLSRLFGSHAKFYRELNELETHRVGLFKEWTLDDFVKDIQRAGSERVESEGKYRPTFDYMASRCKRSAHLPHPDVILRSLGISRYGAVLELAGYPDVKAWDEDDYIDWGVKFMEANDGQTPIALDINFLSKLSRGPSTRTVLDHFNYLADYQQKVRVAYEQKTETDKVETRYHLTQADEYLASGILPTAAFEGELSDAEKLLRYAKYLVLDELLSDSFAASKLSITTIGNDSIREAGFIRSIRKCNNAITAGDIESTALSLSVFDILWPLNSHLSHLKINKQKRGRQIIRSVANNPLLYANKTLDLISSADSNPQPIILDRED